VARARFQSNSTEPDGTFVTIRHDRMLAKVARRISDSQVLAMVKQFLKSAASRAYRNDRRCAHFSRTWR